MKNVVWPFVQKEMFNLSVNIHAFCMSTHMLFKLADP